MCLCSTCVTSGGQERVVQPQGLIPRLCLRAAGDLEETLVSLRAKEMLSPCTRGGGKVMWICRKRNKTLG